MKGTDRFLIVLVIGIVAVVVVAVVAVAQWPGQDQYQPEDTPEGVVFNYLLALQRGDLERAYGYLSPDLLHMPADAEQMAKDLDWQLDRMRSSSFHPSLSIESSRMVGDKAIVTVAQTWTYRGDLLGSDHSTYTFEVELLPFADTWKIIDSEDYWAHGWTHRE